MKKLAKVPLYVLGAGAAAFVGTFTMYMFNLDMKLMTVIEPLLAKWYDSREHDFYLSKEEPGSGRVLFCVVAFGAGARALREGAPLHVAEYGFTIAYAPNIERVSGLACKGRRGRRPLQTKRAERESVGAIHESPADGVPHGKRT